MDLVKRTLSTLSIHSLHRAEPDSDEIDGLWLCCQCNCKSPLVHMKGKHPFTNLKCTSSTCNHVMCQCCQSTSVLTPVRIMQKGAEVNSALFCVPKSAVSATGEACYCAGCLDCGYTRRAELHNRPATEKLSFAEISFTWTCSRCQSAARRYFRIGDGRTWRLAGAQWQSQPENVQMPQLPPVKLKGSSLQYFKEELEDFINTCGVESDEATGTQTTS